MNNTPEREEKSETAADGGLYKQVKVSAKTVERVIVVLFALLLVLLIAAVNGGGYTVSFDPGGGTDISAQKLEYGELVAEPPAPYREGYVFTGWYLDEGKSVLWDFAKDTVSDDMTLYAAWKPVG